MPTTLTVDFSGDGTVAPGGAGSTTGAGHGIIDVLGGRASRVLGNLVITQNGGLDYVIAALTLPIDALINESATVTIPAGLTQFGFQIGLRCADAVASTGRFVHYGCVLEGSDFHSSNAHCEVITVLDSTGVGSVIPRADIPGYDSAHQYSVTFSATDANPTTLRVVIHDDTANAEVLNSSATDSESNNGSSLQAAGTLALFPYGNGGIGGVDTAQILAISATVDAGIPALVAPLPVVTSRAIRQTALSITASGGTPPYTYQWHRVKDSINWIAGGGNAIGGATADTYTDNAVLPGDLWVYRCVVADSGAQSQASNYLLTEALSFEPGTPLRSLGPDGVIVVEIGDSITAAGTPGTSMATRLGVLGVSPVHHSNQGHSSSQLTVEWDTDTDPSGYIADAVSATNALLVTYPGALVIWSVMLGTNDARNSAPTPSDFAAGLTKLAALCASNGWLLACECAPWIEPGGVTAAQMDLLISYRAATVALADGRTLFAGDLHSLPEFYSNRATYFDADPVHPNATGSAALGVLWANAIRRSALAGSASLTLGSAGLSGGSQLGTYGLS